MPTYTVIGLHQKEGPQVAGVIEGRFPTCDDRIEAPGRFTWFIFCRGPAEAEQLALLHEGDYVGVMWAVHKTAEGKWCPWSFSAAPPEFLGGAERCPAGCPGSRVVEGDDGS